MFVTVVWETLVLAAGAGTSLGVFQVLYRRMSRKEQLRDRGQD